MRLTHVRPAVLRHPITGRRVWFNQADEFHPSINGPEFYEAMLEMHGGRVHELEMFVTFGDGSHIPLKYLQEVRNAIRETSRSFPWRCGDLLELDNLRIAHGRNAFRGARRVLVSMFDEVVG